MGVPIFIRAFRKVNMVLDCRIFKSNLFYFYIAEVQNKTLKISVLMYIIPASFNERVLYMWLLFGIRSNKSEGKPLILIWKKVQSFLNNRLNVWGSKPISLCNLNLAVSLIAPVIVEEALYWILSIWLIIDQITIIKVRPYKRFINRNQRISWKNVV